MFVQTGTRLLRSKTGEVASSKTQLFNWRPFRTFLKNQSNEFEAICCEPQIFCLKFVQKAREQLQFCEMAKSVERVWWFLFNMVVGRRSLMLLYCVVLYYCIVLYFVYC